MFSILPYNKIILDKKDSASFAVDIYTLDDKLYKPAEDDVLQLNIFTTEKLILQKVADIVDDTFTFSFENNDTAGIEPSIYFYNVILNPEGEHNTVIKDSFFEIRGEMPEVI